VLSAIQTMNDSSLQWKSGCRTDITHNDVISYNGLTSVLSSYDFGRNMHFIGL